MPNSRLIPTTPTTTTNRKRSNSAAPVYHQSTTKKGFMSRLLTKSNTEQPFHHEYRVEKKVQLTCSMIYDSISLCNI